MQCDLKQKYDVQINNDYLPHVYDSYELIKIISYGKIGERQKKYRFIMII